MDITMISYGVLVLALLGSIAYVTYLVKTKQTNKMLNIIKVLVDEAEAKYGSGTGELKYDYVVSHVYKFMPSFVKVFVSEKLLDLWIEKAVDELQETLDKQASK